MMVKADSFIFYVTQAITVDVSVSLRVIQCIHKDSFIDMHEEDQYFIW